jgi:hypothetical protein
MKRLVNKYLLLAIFVVISISGTIFITWAAPANIGPQGGNWYDTNGNLIEAHDGGMIKVGNTYYLYGNDRSATVFYRVNIYSSTDLASWTFKNSILTRTTHSDLNNGNIVERPKIIYNDTTHKYVMWFHYDNAAYSLAEVGTASCDTVDGNYTYLGHFRPDGHDSRDMSLFKDSDGSAYLISTTDGNAKTRIHKLTADYLGIASEVTDTLSGEGISIFKKDGLYYGIFSSCTGWSHNDNWYQYASSLAGPWSSGVTLADAGTKTYESQITYTIPVTGSGGTTYMYMGDRWDGGNVTSRYVWLPIQFNGNNAHLDYYNIWTIDTVTGAWSAPTPTPSPTPPAGLVTIPHSQMTATATSQQTGYEAGKAIDNSNSTMWHTAWNADWTPAVPLPQSITLNLGGTYNVCRLRYWPRQDGSPNGRITGYNLYLSTDGTNFTKIVNGGTWADDTTEKVSNFAAASARYLKLEATVANGGFVSAAEINVEYTGSGATPTPTPTPTFTAAVTFTPTPTAIATSTPTATPGTATSFATAVSLGSEVRNDFGDYVGMKITVGNSSITVKQLGRYFVSGNSGTHTLKIIRDSDKAELGNLSLSMSVGSADSLGFKYASLATPVALSANTAYYIVSLESNGGDQWYGRTSGGLPLLTVTNVATVNYGIYYYNSAWNTMGSTGRCYIPLNFKY